MSTQQCETAECSSVGKLTTASVQRPQRPPPRTLSNSPSHPCPLVQSFCLHVQFHNYFSPPGSLLALPPRRDSFSHTLWIMFASFQWTNTTAVRATICSTGRIFNYFSRPCHLGLWNRTFSNDIFQRCQLKMKQLFILTVLSGVKSTCSFVF